jgi:hypothetical protein
VPVEADVFNGSVPLGSETAFSGLDNEPEEQAGTDDHVQGVQAGHAEVEREEELGVGVDGHLSTHFFGQILQLGSLLREILGAEVASAGIIRAVVHIKAEAGDVVLDIFVVVLDGLDAQKDGAQDKSGDQKKENLSRVFVQFLYFTSKVFVGKGADMSQLQIDVF